MEFSIFDQIPSDPGKNKKFQHGSTRTLAEPNQKYIHVKYLP
jgi:hypothetical protein